MKKKYLARLIFCLIPAAVLSLIIYLFITVDFLFIAMCTSVVITAICFGLVFAFGWAICNIDNDKKLV